MPTQTYDLLDSTTLGSASASVSFTSIDQTYKDLVLVIYAKRSSSGDIELKFNNSTADIFRFLNMVSDGSNQVANSDNRTRATLSPGSTTTAVVTCHLIDYAATDKYKVALARSDDGTNKTVASMNRLENDGAITQLDIEGGANFDAGSTFSLYGIEG